MLVDLGKAEAVLPWSEQIPRQNFKVGDQIKICIADVDMTTKGPVIRVSRANNEFLIGLFKYYIPEIQEGVVRIRSVVREPGIRSKIAVYCEENRIDPVGACVGLKGSRIKDIVAELSGEKIDIIKWDEDLAVFTNNSLSPAKVTSITIQPDRNSCLVVVPDNQLSLAIGREGQNVRLAARLTGCKIDIKSDSQYKEYLTKLMDGTLHIADDGSVVESELKGEAMDEEIVIGTEAAPVVEPEFTEDSVFMKEVVEEAADDTSEAKSLETGQTI
jgi:N utilization substance protein A